MSEPQPELGARVIRLGLNALSHESVPAPEPCTRLGLTPPSQCAEPRPPVISLRAIHKQFGSVVALQDVDFEIYPREVVGVVGDNGAGKSVLAKIISGVYAPDHGTITWDGRPLSIPSPGAAHELGIATVFQDLALCDNLDLVENLFLGREARGAVALDERTMEATARQVLAQLDVRLPPLRTKVAGLSGGQRQAVAVARALLGSPRIVVLDEPTSSLSVSQTAEVLNLIEHLRRLDYGVMLIGHNLADIQAVADRIVVLRHGRINGAAPMSEVTYESIIAAITGVPNDLTRATQRRRAAAH